MNTAIRNTLVALALALVSVTSSPASAEERQNLDYDYAMITLDRNLGQKSPKGLATKKSSKPIRKSGTGGIPFGDFNYLEAEPSQ